MRLRSNERRRRPQLFAGSVLLLILATACTPIPAYKRGRLVQATMQGKPSLDSGFDTHVSELRESALGASSGENASCGCR